MRRPYRQRLRACGSNGMQTPRLRPGHSARRSVHSCRSISHRCWRALNRPSTPIAATRKPPCAWSGPTAQPLMRGDPLSGGSAKQKKKHGRLQGSRAANPLTNNEKVNGEGTFLFCSLFVMCTLPFADNLRRAFSIYCGAEAESLHFAGKPIPRRCCSVQDN